MMNDIVDDVVDGELVPVGVEDAAGGEPTLSPRDEKMAALIAEHNDQDSGLRVDSLGDVVEDSVADDMDEDERLERDMIKASELAANEAKESPVYVDESGKSMVRMKVNGVELSRPLDSVIATAQKHESADVRLQKTTEQQRIANEQIQRERERLNEYRKTLDAENARLLGQQNTQLSSQDVGEDDLESAKAVMDQIYDGNTDDAAQKLAQLIQRRPEPTRVDEQAIQDRATQAAVARMDSISAESARKESISKGINKLNEVYPEVMKNPVLMRSVDTEINVITQADPSIMPEEAIKKAAETVLAQMGRLTPAPKESTRKQDKANLQRQPARQLSKGHAVRKEPEVDTSPAGVLERMRNQRHALAGRSTT